MSPNAGDGGSCGVSTNEYTAVHRSPNKFWRSNFIFNLGWHVRIRGLVRQFYRSGTLALAVQLIVIFCEGIYRTNLAAAGGMPTSPELIRMEVAITQTDFNTRLKQVTNFYQYFPLFLYISWHWWNEESVALLEQGFWVLALLMEMALIQRT